MDRVVKTVKVALLRRFPSAASITIALRVDRLGIEYWSSMHAGTVLGHLVPTGY